jgi:hypothetical protein
MMHIIAEHLAGDRDALAVRLRTSADLDLRALNSFEAQSFELPGKSFSGVLVKYPPEA